MAMGLPACHPSCEGYDSKSQCLQAGARTPSAREDHTMERRVFLSLLAASVTAGGAGISRDATIAHAAGGDKKNKIGFLPGGGGPIYQGMQLGVEGGGKGLWSAIVTPIPQTWGGEVQTPILDSMVARGDLNYIVTAPTDKDQMIGPLKTAAEAGIKIITVDTFLGDGDYAAGPVTFPISYIGSDNVEGGRISGRGLA